MKRRELLVGGTVLAALGGCASDSKISRRYTGQMADGIVVRKAARKMYILKGETVLARYDIDLGFSPVGHKFKSGDGRTPEGQYWIDRKNYNSAFYLSLGISYPNARDRARAKAAGVDPGGDIFIHGAATRREDKGKADWTAGCISVSNREMETIFQMVPHGTPIWISA